MLLGKTSSSTLREDHRQDVRAHLTWVKGGGHPQTVLAGTARVLDPLSDIAGIQRGVTHLSVASAQQLVPGGLRLRPVPEARQVRNAQLGWGDRQFNPKECEQVGI